MAAPHASLTTADERPDPDPDRATGPRPDAENRGASTVTDAPPPDGDVADGAGPTPDHRSDPDGDGASVTREDGGADPGGPADRIDPPSAPAGVGPRGVIARLLVAGAVAVVLSSQHLVDVAERMPFGTGRSVALALATTLDDGVGTVHLDAPDTWIRQLTGRAPADDGDGTDILDSEPFLTAATPPTVTAPERTPAGEEAGPTDGPTTTAFPIEDALAVTSPSTTTPPVTTAPGRPVDPSSKLRVWAGGDSLGEYVGGRLLHPLSNRDLSEVQLDYHISTGLTRPDYFDWPLEMWNIMHAESPPEALVFMVGGNDDQNMSVDGTVIQLGTEEWRAEYARRVAFVMDASSLGGGHLYWIGLPPMRDPARDEVARTINAVLAEEAAARPWVTYVDIVPRFTGPDGGFSTNIAAPDGTQKVARAADGVHITLAGSTWVAEDIWAAIDQHWALSPPPPPPGPAPDGGGPVEAPGPEAGATDGGAPPGP